MTDQQVLTIAEYCKREKISRASLYKEWAQGRGPKSYHRGTHRLISVQAADEYRRQLEEGA
ncbi:MAG TPA: transcriptional regulator [Bradyrhizobium sp.]|jgi:hypothetical protein|nr:transcriptional regulator [Bradyrhizobium sp.]